MSDIFIPGVVAGVFALLGAFAGAALTRGTEYEKWLRQVRTEAFATLLRELHDTRLYATTAYYDEPGTECCVGMLFSRQRSTSLVIAD